MSWENVDNKHKKAIDKENVSCEEDYEVNYLVKIIKEEYPFISEIDIRKSIASCCVSTNAPHPRKEFMECLRKRLGVK